MDKSDLIYANHLGTVASRVHQVIEHRASTSDLERSDFTISARNKMEMYTDAGFETGVAPCRLRLPDDTKFNGAAILFSTEKNDASIDVILGLDSHEMELLENNSNFRRCRPNLRVHLNQQ